MLYNVFLTKLLGVLGNNVILVSYGLEVVGVKSFHFEMHTHIIVTRENSVLQIQVF